MSEDNVHRPETPDPQTSWAFRKLADAGQITVMPSPSGDHSGRSSGAATGSNTPSSQVIMDQRDGYFDMEVFDPTQVTDPRFHSTLQHENHLSSNEQPDPHQDSTPVIHVDKGSKTPISNNSRTSFASMEPSHSSQSLHPNRIPLNDISQHNADQKESQPATQPPWKDRLLEKMHEKFPRRIVHRIIKATLAYVTCIVLCSIGAVAQALGPAAYLAITGSLFTHPGRTMGAQIDATITSVLGIALAICWALAGMAASIAYNRGYEHDLPNHQAGVAINAGFLIVGIMFAQILRMRFPKFQFFSLQFMIVQIFCNTKLINLTEMQPGGVLNFGIPLMLGAGVSLFYNLILWRETAVDGLGRALLDTVKGSQEMLKLITDQFELEFETADIDVDGVNTAAGKMRAGYTKIMTAYRDSKYELSHAYISPIKAKPIYKSLNSLTKHLGILGASFRSEKALFEAALKTYDEESDSDDDVTWRATAATNAHLDQVYGGSRSGASTPRHRRNNSEDMLDQNQLTVNSTSSMISALNMLAKNKPPKKRQKQIEFGDKQLFIMYIESLRDPLLVLAQESTRALNCVSAGVSYEWELDDVRQDGTHSWAYYLSHIFRSRKTKTSRKGSSTDGSVERHCSRHCDCPERMRAAIEKFDVDENKRMESLRQLRRKRDFVQLDLGLREEVFLVFFFIFCLREVAKELESLTSTLNDIKDTVDRSKNGRRKRHFYLPNLTGGNWVKWASFSSHQAVRDKGGHTLQHFRDNLPREKTSEFDEDVRLVKIQSNLSTARKRSQSVGAQSMRRRKSSRMVQTSDMERVHTIDETARGPNFRRESVLSIPDAIDEDIEAAPPPDAHKPRPPLNIRLRYFLWQVSRVLSSYDFKFAVKMATAVLILCLPAYIPSSQAWYASVRGQWASVTVIAIMNPTTGGTINGCLWRIVGTFVGVLVGWAALAVDPGPYATIFFGFILCIVFFYVHLATMFNRVAIVVLIAYEIVAVGERVNPLPGESIEQMVLKRTITMLVGIGTALIFNWFLWPFVARHQLRKALADVILELGEYYAFLISAFLYDDVHRLPAAEDIKSCDKQERNLQRAIVACRDLLDLTYHEPGLKAPFPTEFYNEMITTTQNLLDRLCNLRCAVVHMPIDVRKETVNADVYLYRRDMTAAFLLHFHTLAVSLKAKQSLPAYMPSARLARIRLINRRRENPTDAQESPVKFKNLTWFAMACSSEEIIEELEHLGLLIRYITGESKNSYMIRASGERLQERQKCAGYTFHDV
ncbi:hypothetical protein INT43_008323, partial [Umbelopsis isabellina]